MQRRQASDFSLIFLSDQPNVAVQRFQKVSIVRPSLVKYLFQVNDISSSDFSKYDDPMTVSTNIIN